MTAVQPGQRACPLCGRPGAAAYRPFCSKRCRDVDLGHWAAEAYAIPAGEDVDDTDMTDDA